VRIVHCLDPEVPHVVFHHSHARSRPQVYSAAGTDSVAVM
jgi:hypothetical protein